MKDAKQPAKQPEKKRVNPAQNTPRRACEKPERRKKEELQHNANPFMKHVINFLRKE